MCHPCAHTYAWERDLQRPRLLTYARMVCMCMPCVSDRSPAALAVDFALTTALGQIQTLNRGLPDNWHGYGYALGSMTTTVALGLIIYGTSVWTL